MYSVAQSTTSLHKSRAGYRREIFFRPVALLRYFREQAHGGTSSAHSTDNRGIANRRSNLSPSYRGNNSFSLVQDNFIIPPHAGMLN